MRWHWGIAALSHGQTSWMASVLPQWGLSPWLLITMCHCTEQNSYMGHLLFFFTLDQRWHRWHAGLEARKTCSASAAVARLDARLGGISDGFWSSWTDLEIATFIRLQSVCRPGRTGGMLSCWSWRRWQKSAGEWNRRPLITKHCIAAAPSHSLSLQWLIHRELHCIMAARCEAEYNTRDFHSQHLAVLYGHSRSASRQTLLGQHSMHWPAPSPHPPLLILNWEDLTRRLGLGSRALASTLPA